jgi:hypothetical protein
MRVGVSPEAYARFVGPEMAPSAAAAKPSGPYSVLTRQQPSRGSRTRIGRLFSLPMNKTPFKRFREIAEVSPVTVFTEIN